MSFAAGLSIVTLGVADLERAVAFYTSLGLRRAASSVDGVISWFDIGGVYHGCFTDPDGHAWEGGTQPRVPGRGRPYGRPVNVRPARHGA